MTDSVKRAIPPVGRIPDSKPVEIIEVDGVGETAGQAYGEACRDVIRLHLDSVLAYGKSLRNLDHDAIVDRARPYRDAVHERFPLLAGEIDGIAAGAGITVEEAWILQLRAEVYGGDVTQHTAECTSFGADRRASRGGTTIAGQNCDLRAFYQDVLVLVRRTQPGKARMLTLTPAGQVAWHGMNEHGVAVFANFLCSDGWRVGVPRYLFTRIALEERSAAAAANSVIALHRASTRNLLIADENEVLDVELAVTTAEMVPAACGVIGHANHHLSELTALECATERYLRNSHRRQNRIDKLLHENFGRIDPETAALILRDRATAPDALSIDPDDVGGDGDGAITVASTIADVRSRRLWVAIGPPHLTSYHAYDV